MEIKIKKATDSDKRRLISNEITSGYELWDEYRWPYLIDKDENFAYFQCRQFGKDVTYRVGYEFESEVKVTLEGDPVEVIATTEYKEVNTTESSSIDKVIKAIEKYFGGSSSKKTQQIYKQFAEEEMIAIEPLYIAAGEVDAVGDTYELEDVYEMVDNVNKAIKDETLSFGLFHKHKSDSFKILKAWVNEEKCIIGDSEIPEGQPIAKIQFTSKEAWELRKSGVLLGLSIGAKAIAEDLEEDA